MARGPKAANLVVDAEPGDHKKLEAALLQATPVDNMFRQALADGERYADATEFVKSTFLDNQPPLAGLKYYEKFRHITS